MLSEFANYFKGLSLENLDELARSFSFGASIGLGNSHEDDVIPDLRELQTTYASQ